MASKARLQIPTELTAIPNPSDETLLLLLRDNPEAGIEAIFRQHYSFVTNVVFRILNQESLSEDIAQEVFFDLWRKRDSLQVHTALKAYLRKAAVNRTLNYIRDTKINFSSDEPLQTLQAKVEKPLDQMAADELENQINQAIDGLPERCRIIFMLSRFEDMSYREIADKLDISEKTIEKQISKALKILRTQLGSYLDGEP